MKPYILTNFNAISKSYYESRKYQIDIHNHILDRPDNRPAKAAYVVTEKSTLAPGGKVYKLKWRGSSNQRIIDVQKSLKKKETILYEE